MYSYKVVLVSLLFLYSPLVLVVGIPLERKQSQGSFGFSFVFIHPAASYYWSITWT